MLLTLVIILVLIWSAVVWSIYSNFLVFYENFTETENYHKARYASLAAIERAELVIKQREPWYEWSWWWILGQYWSTWYLWSDKITSWFSYLSNINSSENKSTVFWNIKSRTTRIPSDKNGNVDKLLASDDSINYNMMDYENAEIFLLYYDKLNGGPYDKKDCSIYTNQCSQSYLNKITWRIRLPTRIRTKFSNLNTGKSLFQEWWFKDDALVDRQLIWNFQSWGLQIQFTFYATQSAAWSRPSDRDSAIREWHLNNSSWVKLVFENSRDPTGNHHPENPTIVSLADNTITHDYNSFKKILHGNSFYNLQLRFSLLNLVLWWWTLAKRYPFLEYYFDFWDVISDKYFTIQTEWNYWDYKIDTVIYKPTITESILKSFTTIL